MAEHLTAFYEFGPFRLDVMERSLLRNGERVPLTPRTFETLLVLVRNRGRVVEKQELMDALWPDSDVEENNLNQSISAVRKALGESASEQRYIKTIARCGYRFVAEVRVVRADAVRMVEGQDASPANDEEYKGPSTQSVAETSLIREVPQVEGRQDEPRRWHLSKRILIVISMLALCLMTELVVLRTTRRSEQHTDPSGETVVGASAHNEKVEVEVWWPKDGVRVSGLQPFKAIATNLSLPEYTMYWQVD